ncbi:ubiquinone-binding protein, partial [Burkholderiaceae bacterium]|nr:ubiquinone-binding protein [Burkholderiaceae bacterium]
MKTVSKSVLLSHSPEEMYALVTDVARYAEFLPWCDRSEVLASTD